MAHQVQPATSVIRNSLDLFCHISAVTGMGTGWFRVSF